MTWTREKPSQGGIYWYREDRDSQIDKYESFKIFWDPQIKEWSARTYENGTVFVNACSGEWYGPIAPPVSISASPESNINLSNTRILIRLRHGGSFHVEKILPEDIAVSLSERLMTIHKQGRSVPVGIRMKIKGVIRELIDFAQAPPKEA